MFPKDRVSYFSHIREEIFFSPLETLAVGSNPLYPCLSGPAGVRASHYRAVLRPEPGPLASHVSDSSTLRVLPCPVRGHLPREPPEHSSRHSM